jgi:hypothetical protein
MVSNVIKKENRKISLNQLSFDQLIIKSVLKVTSSSTHLDQKPAASVIGRKRPKRLTKTMEDYGRIEDGRQSKICYIIMNSTSKHGVQCGAVCNY